MSHDGQRRGAGQRVLDAALALIRERGLAVGLDQISLEEAIAASGVSRATAYRQWTSRAEFLRDVLLAVVRGAVLEAESDDDIAALRSLMATQRDGLLTPQGRRTFVVESLRIATQAGMDRIAGSRPWRDHVALRATCESLPAGELRDAVAAELGATERAFSERRAAVYARLAPVLGYRLVPWLNAERGFMLLAEALGALMIGLAGRTAIVGPGAPMALRAFGSTVESAWTSESYAIVATVLAYLEPDPGVVWDDARVALTIERSYDLEREARSLRPPVRQD